jgi:hypothetical protein
MTVMITITLRARQRGILGPDFPVTIRAQRGLAAGHLVEGLEVQETDRTLWIFLIARRSLRSQLLLKGECSKYFTAQKKIQIYQHKTQTLQLHHLLKATHLNPEECFPPDNVGDDAPDPGPLVATGDVEFDLDELNPILIRELQPYSQDR